MQSQLVKSSALVQGYRIAYANSGAGEPVILIHGTPSSSYIWRNVVPELTRWGNSCFVFDLLGYGLSERPFHPDVDTSVAGQVSVLNGLMEHWGLEKGHIVAHDIGGAVGQRFALFHPDRVSSLTLIDSVSFNSWPSERTQAQMKAGIDRLVKAPDQEHREHFRSWLLSAVFNKEAFANHALGVFLDLISGPVGQASFFQHQVAHYDHRFTAEIASRLNELERLPVQIIWGENDAWQVVDWAYRLNEAIPGSELHVLQECGHFSIEDKPFEIASLVNTFVKRNSGS